MKFCMADPLRELRFATRSLARSPGFSAVAVVTLALGIGANTAVFSLLNAVLLRPLPYPDPDRLVLIWESAPFFGLTDSPVSPANYVDWKERARSFEEMGALEIAGYRLSGDGAPEMVLGAVVTSGVFRALGTGPLLGRVFRESDDRNDAPKVAIISEGLWRRRFAADPGIVGKTIRLGEKKHTVVGVIASGNEPPTQYVKKLSEIWTPLGAAYTPKRLAERGRHNWMVIARLKPGVTLGQADAEMRLIGAALAGEYPDTNEKVGAFVAPFRNHFVQDSRRTLLLLFGTVAFVLLIACSNLANLLLSRAGSRRREVSIRAALGAGIWPIARAFVWESLLLSVLGSALGLLLGTTTFRYLAHFAPGGLTGLNSLSIDLRVLGFTAALSVAVTVVFSLVPLIQVRRLDLNNSLKQSGRTFVGSDSNRTRALLVSSQVALVFMLATSAALLIQTFTRLRSVETGFRTENVLTVGLPRVSDAPPTLVESETWQREVLARVSTIPGVVSAGFTNHVPIAFKGDISGVTAEGRDERDRVQCRARTAGPGYMTTMGIPILRGRDIADSDRDGAPRVALVNEALAKELWPGQEAVGRSLVFGTNVSVPVVGVVRDIHQAGLDEAPKPEFYVSTLQVPALPGSLVIHTKVDPASIAGAVRKAVWSLNPEQPVTDVLTMNEVVDNEVLQRRRHAMLLTVFAALALMLAAIGLYGVLSYALSRKIPEFAVRLALGASPGTLLGRIIGDGLRMTSLGICVGIAGAMLLSRLLAAFLFGVEATDPATYLLVAIVLALTSALASYLPGRRAMRIDAVAALRQE